MVMNRPVVSIDKSVRRYCGLFTLALCLAACSTVSVEKDGAPIRSVDVSTLADAQPEVVKRTRAGNKSPYTVLGKTYRVLEDASGFREVGLASWYGTKFHGRHTSNGEVYDMFAMTAAHKSIPIPSFVRVTNQQNGRSVVVRVNDRGPFHNDRIIDLSYAAAMKLGYAEMGTARVALEVITPAGQQATKHLASPQLSSGKGLNKSVSGKNTYLQMGAFGGRRAAEGLLQKISAAVQFPVRIKQHQQLYKVQVGPFTPGQNIQEIRQMLEAKNLTKPHVVYD